MDNIWLLGGEIIGRVNFDETLREKNGPELVEMHIDEFGGPYSKHLDTQGEKNSFDSACKKLYKFLRTNVK